MLKLPVVIIVPVNSIGLFLLDFILIFLLVIIIPEAFPFLILENFYPNYSHFHIQ